jgi:hypothetical protein
MTLPELARQAISIYLESGKIIVPPAEIAAQYRGQAGTFVSLHTKDGRLRGCIGTFSPTKENISEEVIHNAISAAVHDPRFHPLPLSELDETEISVDVLSPPEPVKDIKELDPKKYGIIISTRDERRGLLLPDIDGVDTTDQQIDICQQKGGINSDEDYGIEKFTVTRYK